MKKNKHKCLICGRVLAKRVTYNVYKEIKAAGGYTYNGFFPTKLEASMVASTLAKGRHEKVKVEGDDIATYGRPSWRIHVTRNGGGFMGLNKVCGRADKKCLRAFLKKAVLL